MIDSPITATYSPATGHVTMTCTLGLLSCVSKISLEAYERRVAAYPSVYPEHLLLEKE